jgi:divalent metal cation (Fe/Co/Zn/Cd) transporter
VGKPDGASTAIEATRTTSTADPVAHRHVSHRASQDGNDLESASPPEYNDPYHLSAAIKPESEMALIRANTSRKRDGCGPITLNRKARNAKKLEEFYEAQNENIERLLKPVDDHRRAAKEEGDANHLKYKIAVIGSFAANILLAILQLYAAISSKSLSLFTTMADSLFDPLSNLTLIMCNRAVAKVDGRKFPSGKARIETAGNLCFCALMITVSVVIIVESIRTIAEHTGPDTNDFFLPSVIAVAIAFATKFGLFLYCWAIRNKYSQVRILWEDHRNDLSINGFGVLTSVGGSKLAWWLDPMGAMILSFLIIFLWSRTAYSEFQLLIGVTADTQMLQHITYICKSPPFPSIPFAKQLLTHTRSNDPLPPNPPNRHRPLLSLGPALDRRSRHRHGPPGNPKSHARRRGGIADQTGEPPRCGARICARRLRDGSSTGALFEKRVVGDGFKDGVEVEITSLFACFAVRFGWESGGLRCEAGAG